MSKNFILDSQDGYDANDVLHRIVGEVEEGNILTDLEIRAYEDAGNDWVEWTISFDTAPVKGKVEERKF